MIRIGIISPAEIAYRRFMPALQQVPNFRFVGVAIYNEEERFQKKENLSESELEIMQREIEKGKRFAREYGGKLFYSYEELITSDEVDALYIPLPPALHDVYAKKALLQGKHVLIEKPSSDSLEKTKEMIEIAKNHTLALYENYMFVYHDQIAALKDMIDSGKIGKIRLYSLKFGFPKRAAGDFRYMKNMGGGSLLDAGGYTMKLAGMLLGDSARVVCSTLNYEQEYDVDLYGSATLVNNANVTAQVAFGMDNGYKCEIEVWGSQGTIKSERIFTAPSGLKTTAIVSCSGQGEVIELADDDAFRKSIEMFGLCIEKQMIRENAYAEIMRQAELIEQAKELSKHNM